MRVVARRAPARLRRAVHEERRAAGRARGVLDGDLVPGARLHAADPGEELVDAAVSPRVEDQALAVPVVVQIPHVGAGRAVTGLGEGLEPAAACQSHPEARRAVGECRRQRLDRVAVLARGVRHPQAVAAGVSSSREDAHGAVPRCAVPGERARLETVREDHVRIPLARSHRRRRSRGRPGSHGVDRLHREGVGGPVRQAGDVVARRGRPREDRRLRSAADVRRDPVAGDRAAAVRGRRRPVERHGMVARSSRDVRRRSRHLRCLGRGRHVDVVEVRSDVAVVPELEALQVRGARVVAGDRPSGLRLVVDVDARAPRGRRRVLDLDLRPRVRRNRAGAGEDLHRAGVRVGVEVEGLLGGYVIEVPHVRARAPVTGLSDRLEACAAPHADPEGGRAVGQRVREPLGEDLELAARVRHPEAVGAGVGGSGRDRRAAVPEEAVPVRERAALEAVGEDRSRVAAGRSECGALADAENQRERDHRH